MPRLSAVLIEASQESFADRDTGRPVEFVRLLLKVPVWGTVKATGPVNVLAGLNGSREGVEAGAIT